MGAQIINRPELSDDAQSLWKYIHGKMRRAKEIIQVKDDIPAEHVAGRGSGEWARAEKLFIDRTPALNAKRRSVNRYDLGLQ